MKFYARKDFGNKQVIIHDNNYEYFNDPVSLYILAGQTFKSVHPQLVDGNGEYESFKPCRVIKEVKYDSIHDMFKQHDIKLIIK
jgi:hypothetical protein